MILLDLDGNYTVDAGDTAMILAAWGTPAHDLSGDGNTDSTDLAILLAAWGKNESNGTKHVHRKQWGVEASFDITLIESIYDDMMVYDGRWVRHSLKDWQWVPFLHRHNWQGTIHAASLVPYMERPEVTYEQAPPPGIGWVVRVRGETP